MFYSLISHTYNPNAAHLNLGLELTLDILDFGLELQEILYKDGTPELPDADSFHQRLYTFALGYFASGTYWHTTTHKFNLENIIADIKSILHSLRNKKKHTKPAQGYKIKIHNTVQTNEYTSSTFLGIGKSHLEAAIAEHSFGIKTGDILQIQRKLLIVLLSDEVERLITWNQANNPKVTSMFAFKDQSYVKQPGMIYGAWKVSPKLAFQYAKRFSYLYHNSQRLIDEIGHLVYLDA